jgi:hypothetical protein
MFFKIMETPPDGSFPYTSKRRRDDQGLDSLQEDPFHESKVWKGPYFMFFVFIS